MQRIGEKLLGEVLAEYIKEAGFGERMRGLDICGLWPEAVGARAVAATRSLNFSDGVLYCRMSSSTVRNMLFYNLEGVRGELNRLAGGNYVRKIVLC